MGHHSIATVIGDCLSAAGEAHSRHNRDETNNVMRGPMMIGKKQYHNAITIRRTPCMRYDVIRTYTQSRDNGESGSIANWPTEVNKK